MDLAIKSFAAILITIACFGTASAQINGLPPLNGVESESKLRIKGIAMTHAEGMPFSLTLFFPNAWNPMDTLRAGQPVAISLMKTQTEYEKVCARGITMETSCFWACELVLPQGDVACLLSHADWHIAPTSMPAMKSETQEVDTRKVRTAHCLDSPYVAYTLEPLSEGSDRRRNHRLRRQLR